MGTRRAATGGITVRRAITALVSVLVAAGGLVALDAAPAAARAAEVMKAPGCPDEVAELDGLDFCADNGVYTLEGFGTLSDGASIVMSTEIPPCESFDGFSTFSPSVCYSGVEFEIDYGFDCESVDTYNPDEPSYSGRCPNLYADGRSAGGYSDVDPDDCSAAFGRAYYNGGPGSDPSQYWSARGPTALESCTFTRTGDPFDGLYGPTWLIIDATLRIEYAGETPAFDYVTDQGYVSIDGELLERGPRAEFDTTAGDDPGEFHFDAERSHAQWNQELTYEWEFQKLTHGVDEDWVTVGNASGRFTSFTWPAWTEGTYAHAILTVADPNDLDDRNTDVWELYVDDDNPPDGEAPIVTVEATDAVASEDGTNTGTWTVTRSESVGPLVVDVSLSGSASAGDDYVAIDDEVSFANGIASVLVTLTGSPDEIVEGQEIATLTAEEGEGYAVGDPFTDDIAIVEAGSSGGSASGGGGGVPSTTGVDSESGASPTGTLSTDNGYGASPSDPVETTVRAPAGPVTIDESALAEEMAHYSLLGVAVDISAPASSPDDPIEFAFELDASILPSPVTADGVRVFRNGVVVPACASSDGTAAPDPCVASRVLQSDGDLIVSVLTSRASRWQFGVPSQACPADETPAASFVDVDANVHERSIACVQAWGVTNGVTPTTYGPAGTVTRAQTASFLARLIELARPGALASDPPDAFDDDDGSTHQDAIDRLAAVGIVRGTGANTYGPTQLVTRAQMATFLRATYEYIAGNALPAGDDAFRDDDTSVHHAAINAVAAAQIARGTSADTYNPAGAVRRDHMASFLTRLIDRLVVEREMPPRSAA